MGRYFKITDLRQGKRRDRYVEAPYGSQMLFSEIDEMVGNLPNPSNDIPHSLEVDGWGELACEGEKYYADEFEVECLTEEEYRECTY